MPLPTVKGVGLARCRRKAVGAVVVRAGGGTRLAFLGPHPRHNDVTRLVTSLIRLPSAHSARVNAQAAARSLTGARLHRESVDRYLVTHAATHRHRPV